MDVPLLGGVMDLTGRTGHRAAADVEGAATDRSAGSVVKRDARKKRFAAVRGNF
jgi:hypothetical protein